MTLDDVLFITVLVAAITWVIVKAVYDREVQHLRRENRMLWRLLSEAPRDEPGCLYRYAPGGATAHGRTAVLTVKKMGNGLLSR